MIYPQDPDRRDDEANLRLTEKDPDPSTLEKVDGDLKKLEVTNEKPASHSRSARFLIWTILNVTSTVGIVSDSAIIVSDRPR